MYNKCHKDCWVWGWCMAMLIDLQVGGPVTTPNSGKKVWKIPAKIHIYRWYSCITLQTAYYSVSPEMCFSLQGKLNIRVSDHLYSKAVPKISKHLLPIY